jgi:hypothetical protein
MKFILIFLLVVFSPSVTLGGETDQYITLGQSTASVPSDVTVSDLFSDYINDQIGVHLEDINSRIGRSIMPFRFNQFRGMSRCESVALGVIKRMGSTWYGAALDAKIETWAENSHNLIKQFPDPALVTTNDYIEVSIFRSGINFVAKTLGAIDRSINVDGVWFGTDKLSHFTASGYLYYLSYLRHRARLGDYKSKMNMVRNGIMMEYTIIGLQTTGVFSFADLEANYQGFQMAVDFCDETSPILKEQDGKWVMNRRVRFADYVNPNWDEFYYQSSYSKGRRAKVESNLRRLGHCKAIARAKVNFRREHYSSRDDSADSFSVAAIRIFEGQGRAPVQSDFTYEKLCGFE